MNRSITVVAVAAAAMVGVAPTAWAATTSPTVRSVTASDLGTWNPATTTTPSTPWFVLPGDQTGGGTYRFLTPTGSSRGGLQLSAPSSGDSIAVATVPPVTSNTANLDVTFDVEPLAQLPKAFQVQTVFVDLDCNGPDAGGVVRAKSKLDTQSLQVGSIRVYRNSALTITADVYPGGSVGTGSGAPVLHAGTEYTLAQFAEQCPTVRDVGTGVVAGTTEVMRGVTYSSWPRTSPLADSIVWRDLFRATGPGSGAAVRVGGHDRIDTAIAVARTVTTHAKYAVLARDDVFPDALAGAALAKYRRAPLLLTPTTRLDPRVATYLRADVVHGGTVYLLGGTGALSNAVEQQVRALGLKVTRLGGKDRYATAAAIARVMDPAGYCGQDEYTVCSVVLTDGTDFADALPATTMAGLQLDGSYFQPAPVLYTRGAVMPKVTLDFMNTAGPATTLFSAYAVGAPAAAAVKTTRFSKDLTSFVSSDRYASSSQVFSALHPPSSPQPVAVASGLDFPDAVLGATLGPVLLTTPTALPGKVADALKHRAASIGKLYVVGTTDVVNNTVASQAQAALSGSTG